MVVINIFTILLAGTFCAVAVKLLGGKVLMGFAAGVIAELAMTFLPVYIIPIPFAFLIIPIAILAVLFYFVVKLDTPKAIAAGAIAYLLSYFVGIYLVSLLPIPVITI